MSAAAFAYDTVAAGATATAATTVTILCLGHRRDQSMWAPLNAVSHIAFGEDAARQTGLSTKFTGTGTALNAAAILSWAAVYAGAMRMLPKTDLPSAIATAASVAAAAYAIDYHVVPRRLTPGFEKRLSGQSLFWIYSALAAGLAAGWAMRAR